MLLSRIKMQDACPEKLPCQKKSTYAVESSALFFFFSDMEIRSLCIITYSSIALNAGPYCELPTFLGTGQFSLWQISHPEAMKHNSQVVTALSLCP